MPRKFRFETGSFMSEISRATTKTTTLLFSEKRTQSTPYWIQSQVRSRLVAPYPYPYLYPYPWELTLIGRSAVAPFRVAAVIKYQKSFVRQAQDEGLFRKSTYIARILSMLFFHRLKTSCSILIPRLLPAVNTYPTNLTITEEVVFFSKLNRIYDFTKNCSFKNYLITESELVTGKSQTEVLPLDRAIARSIHQQQK